MAVYYLDSSVLVKRYVPEIGSNWMISLFENPDNQIITAKISLVEVISAIARKLRENIISENEYIDLLDVFLTDCDREYLLIDLNDSIIETSIKLLKRNTLRAYDAIQLSSSLYANDLLVRKNLKPLIFISSDDKLILASKNARLLTENPNFH